ncbi:inositol 2-dehydrogenase (plasmid) [Rhizobium sp. CB3171]|uniref:inositol 2-dehydrogenase n=1 Tax=Rhizobium sp. CB3171 TaxID=3039157 RepID=UPI0024B08FB9|nr:inositol 2-dehydrogenase [Rhizobium sp. CB3171]WFU05108.1 inositol 2-dehydrogenase [Rhizobium sp. CB3171]
MKFCVFGAGRMGAQHIANVAANENAVLEYVVDVDLSRAQALAARYGAKATDNPRVALNDPAVDAVIIASATNTHVDLIVDAAKAGKAVLCEKPIDLDIARVDYCAQQISGLNVPIMIGFQRRFDATHMAVRKAVAGGEVGQVEVITIVSRDPSPPPASYIKVSGGQFHDQMIHDFDMALWLAEPKGSLEICAMGSNLVDPAIGEAGDTDTAQVLIRFANGAFCRIDCSRRATYGYDQRVEVFGSKGMVTSANLLKTGIERFGAAATNARDTLLPGFMERYLPTYATELDYFIDAVSNERKIESDFQSGRKAVLLADAARKSLKEGTVVRLDLDA